MGEKIIFLGTILVVGVMLVSFFWMHDDPTMGTGKVSTGISRNLKSLGLPTGGNPNKFDDSIASRESNKSLSQKK